MEFNIENYLNSLSEDTITINVSHKNLMYIPSLSRFTKLETLHCHDNKLTFLPPLNKQLENLYCFNNQLTSLPPLNENLKILWCRNNELIYLPPLNKNLETLNCRYNQLTSLPPLNEKLEVLDCRNNRLTSLPPLNDKLEILDCADNILTYLPPLNTYLQTVWCSNNQLTSLPIFNENLEEISVYGNPIHEIITEQNVDQQKIQIRKLKNFRYLYYCLKFKRQFRDWLWVKIREPKIRRKYHPSHLNSLEEDADLDVFLDDWIQTSS